MTYLLFVTALGLSAVAAYYSIMGLVAIFAAAATPIFIMGSLLEASKLVVASWLYRSWKDVPRLMKIYFTTALVILMMLTSMGIFGFLSKAHLDQAIPTGDVSAKLALIDEKIKTEKENLNASRKELSQLDAQVDQTISRTTEASGAERAIAIRRGQQKDRARILNEIGQTQAKIAKLNEERAPIASEVRKVEAEVGPIKYIAALIYGDNIDEGLLEKAVRIVTILIVLVFDPLAVLLLIAANWNLRNSVKSDWSSFFNKEPSSDFPDPVDEKPTHTELQKQFDEFLKMEEEEVKEQPTELHLNDGINVEEQHDTQHTRDHEIPEIQVEESGKDWEPELFKIRRGDVITESQYPDNKDVPPKTASFMRRVIDSLRTKEAKLEPIQQEVEDLQKNTPK